MLTAEQLKGARAMLGWSASKLAKEAGLGIATIQRMESRGTGASTSANVELVRRALEAAGIQFIDKNGGGEGIRFTKPLQT